MHEKGSDTLTETLFMRHRLMTQLYRSYFKAEGTAFIMPPTMFGLLVHAENVERIMGMDTLSTDTIGDYTVTYAVIPKGTLAFCIRAVDSRLAVAEHTIPSESELWLKYLINGLAATTEGVPTEGADFLSLICKGLANTTEGTAREGFALLPMLVDDGCLASTNGIGREGILPLCIDVGGAAYVTTYLIGTYPEGAVLMGVSFGSSNFAVATEGSGAKGIMLLTLVGDGDSAFADGSEAEGIASTEVKPFGRMDVSHSYTTEENAAGGITYYITSDYHMESDGTVYIGGNYAE